MIEYGTNACGITTLASHVIPQFPDFSSKATKVPTRSPTWRPSYSPDYTPPPTKTPTFSPTKAPSMSPTYKPSYSPDYTPPPTKTPTFSPTKLPTGGPSNKPTNSPGFSSSPIIMPTRLPSSLPSKSFRANMRSGKVDRPQKMPFQQIQNQELELSYSYYDFSTNQPDEQNSGEFKFKSSSSFLGRKHQDPRIPSNAPTWIANMNEPNQRNAIHTENAAGAQTYYYLNLPPSIQIGNPPLHYYDTHIDFYYSPKPTSADHDFIYFRTRTPTVSSNPTSILFNGYQYAGELRPTVQPTGVLSLAYYGDFHKIHQPTVTPTISPTTPTSEPTAPPTSSPTSAPSPGKTIKLFSARLLKIRTKSSLPVTNRIVTRMLLTLLPSCFLHIFLFDSKSCTHILRPPRRKSKHSHRCRQKVSLFRANTYRLP